MNTLARNYQIDQKWLNTRADAAKEERKLHTQFRIQKVGTDNAVLRNSEAALGLLARQAIIAKRAKSEIEWAKDNATAKQERRLAKKKATEEKK